MKTGIVLGILAVIFGFILTMGAMFYFGVSNSEITLRNEIKAQQTNVKVVFDTTWKIIQQQAEVADQYKEGFAKIYSDLMTGRYGDPKKERKVLLSFITESNPNFDVKLYEKVSVSIEAQRINFANEQKKLIDLKREHDTLRQVFPSSLVVGSRPEIQLEIVTSTKTDNAFKTGKEDNTKLFDN
jgi:hypothetical protein